MLPVRTVTFPSGHKYVGQIGTGTMNGLGVYAFDSNQARYEGEVCILPWVRQFRCRLAMHMTAQVTARLYEHPIA